MWSRNLNVLVVPQGEQWKKTTLKTALYFPGVCFCIFFCLNFLVWGQKSSGAGMPLSWSLRCQNQVADRCSSGGVSACMTRRSGHTTSSQQTAAILDDYSVMYDWNHFLPGPRLSYKTRHAAVVSCCAVPFGTLFVLCFLWFGISVPLVFVGSYFGYKSPAYEDPVRTNKIPRQIPEQPWYMNPVFSVLIGGILPFGAVFIELFFILTSMWLHQFYYLFGFLCLVFVILVITCAEITIVLCYFQLCSEDYRWW